jgi:1,4-dihydroxy-2-naphthoate octaprenyltransferase
MKFENKSFTHKLRSWVLLSRLPFHTVGVLPFILGSLLVWHRGFHLDWIILAWGVACVVFIMLATYYSGEYFDYETDFLSAKMEKNRFSGGSQVLQMELVSKSHVLIAAIICLILALVIASILQFYYKTGVFTISLAFLGLLGGFFYSAKPIQWVYRGVGEIWIAFCYGWLAVSTPFYIQTGKMPPIVHWTALPIAFTIFNVILINEFPDYPADRMVGKRNLVVRIGKVRASRIYIFMNLLTWVSYLLTVMAGIPAKALLFFSPVFLLSLITTIQALKGKYEDHIKLEKICAQTLVINLGTTASLIMAILF